MAWMEIFKAGTQKDSSGKEKNWTEKDLDEIVSKYNPSVHEAPLTIGHPADNKPDWGWIDSIKREGNTLLAKTKDIVPAFSEMLKNKMFKKRSVSFSQDYGLRHVGFLGAMPPAVKGLADYNFKEENEITYYQDEIGGNEMDEKEKEIQELKSKLSEFSEKEKTKDDEIASLKIELARKELEARKKEHNDFCEKHIEKITPANKNDVVDFMEVMHNAGSYDFAEGTEKNALQRFKGFLEKLSKRVEFSEVATKDKAAVKQAAASSEFSEYGVDGERLQLHEKALEYAEKNNVSYGAAIKKVMKEV